MQHTSIRHTLDIFERLYNYVEPILPGELKDEMLEAYEQVRDNHTLSLGELEETMVVFGKKVWPYRKALEEFVGLYEGKLGEELLRNAMPGVLRRRYDEFIACGGDLHDVHSGSVAHFFTPDERLELTPMLIEKNRSVKEHAIQAIRSTDQKDFSAKAVRFTEILEEIEGHLDGLRAMADEEQEHPHLAEEMREQVKAFEYGLCLLGPEQHMRTIVDAREYYNGRRVELRAR